MRLILSLTLALLLAACAAEAPPDAADIVERARAVHGSDAVEGAEVAFRFRERRFRAVRDGGRFHYERTFADSIDGALAQIRDVLDNDGVRREVDGRAVMLSDSLRASVESGTNSVIYFALLPLNLRDEAAQKRYLGLDTLRGEPYHQVEVTFQPEGGGRDWEDRFVYWFHAQDYTMDYLAYRFHVDGGGTRFREAYNARTVGGVRFADHYNYTADGMEGRIEHYSDLLGTDSLRLLSEIVLDSVTVRPL